MYCKNCGENNPENAIYCKNCGQKLKEEVKKAEIIENPTTNQNYQQNTYTSSQSTSNTSSNNNNSDWLGCCLCLVGIFIVFAILSI